MPITCPDATHECGRTSIPAPNPVFIRLIILPLTDPFYIFWRIVWKTDGLLVVVIEGLFSIFSVFSILYLF